MADNANASSRSRRQRKSRSNRRKSKRQATMQSSAEKLVDDVIAEATYRVESPETPPPKPPITKSKSLDDDDIKITEVTTEHCDLEWETAKELSMTVESPQQFGTMTIISLPLAQTSRFTPEDERSLRDFLRSLNLADSAEESKTKRAKNRDAIIQHFLPIYQNPRCLDVISEENSDVSDYGNIEYIDDSDEVFEAAPSEVAASTWTTSTVTGSCPDPEIVFLEDSSPSVESCDVFTDEDLAYLRKEIDDLISIAVERLEHRSNDIEDDSSSSSDSRSESQCTAVYNPIHSSLTNISAFLKEATRPQTLKEMCIERVMLLPFGDEVLEELANVSQIIEDMTNQSATNTWPLNASHEPHKPTVTNDLCCVLPEQPADPETWTGLPLDNDPKLFLCLSPSQKTLIDSLRPRPKEADNLLDLHRKFLNRRSYIDETKPIERGTIKHLQLVDNSYVPYKQKPPKMHSTHENINYDKYIRQITQDVPIQVEKQINKPVNNLVYTNAMLPVDDNSRLAKLLPHSKTKRHSLPCDLYDRQMKYIIEMEQQVQREIELLNQEKLRLERESPETKFDVTNYNISRKGDIAIIQEGKSTIYNEYMNRIEEINRRKQNKVIKITPVPVGPTSDNHRAHSIGDEFINRVKQRMCKLGLGEEGEQQEESVKTWLPKHLEELVDDGIWSPHQHHENTPQTTSEREASPPKDQRSDDPVPAVWIPKSAGSSPTVERKEFKPLKFESPTFTRKNISKESSPATTPETSAPAFPPWKQKNGDVCAEQRRLTTSQSAPLSGFNNLTVSKLPKVQNPTVTLLQKAREGQLPRGAHYIEHKHQMRKDEKPPVVGSNEIVYTVTKQYINESDSEKPKKMTEIIAPRKIEGIGPTTTDGMPLVLRSEVKDANQAKWYKRMYDTLHRAKGDDEYVTVRYKQRRGGYPYASAGGYLSEPEANAYDSDATVSSNRYATLDRRRLQTKDKQNEYISYTVPRNNKLMSASVKHSTDVYKNQPGRIEDYIPGHSSISEREAKEHLEQQKRVPPSNSYMSHALKESGYESDSTLVFRRKDDANLQLSPQEQKEAYKSIQRGGEVPLHGLRKPAPERPKEPEMGPTPPPKGQRINKEYGSESPRKYMENEVTIHYRSPIRHEIKESVSEEELARRQAEAMRRIYQEERRRKYLQELQDMNSRRHTDNFTPSQKSPIPLNRYDDFLDDLSYTVKVREYSPEPRTVARALYNFVGQSSKELTFKKGDIVYVRRKIDKNWYEGEHNAMIGLFPASYVEVVPFEGVKTTPRKANEGQARAKFNFRAQTQLELSLTKGELVVLSRRVDDNWFEGRIGNRKGIFPASYVDVLIDPSEKTEGNIGSTVASKPVASPAAHSMLLNGSSGGKESMGSHHYQPIYHTKQAALTSSGSYGSLARTSPAVNQVLHIDTHSEPIPYRALYKYRPQNDDELELLEGDTVYVLEKCDDGWYVGSSHRSGAFGTFPGNYVERI